MATLKEWQLSHGQTYLSPTHRGLLYYAYTSGSTYVGELDTQKDTAREWPVPLTLNPLHGGTPAAAGGVMELRGQVWLALKYWGQIVAFDPSKGKFTAYYSSPTANVKFFDPMTIRVEASDRVWFTAKGAKPGAPSYSSIGLLDLSANRAVLWRCPIGADTPEGLWIESPTTVWFSTYYRLAPFNFCLCRLDVAANRLDYWRHRSLSTQLLSRGVVGAALRGQVQDIWFAYDILGAGYAQVGRFNVTSGQFFEYVPSPPASPYKLALDRSGALWIGHARDAKVSGIDPNRNCNFKRVRDFKHSDISVEPDIIDIAVTPPVASSFSSPTVNLTNLPSVNPVPDNCYEHFSISGTLTRSLELSLSAGGALPPTVFFTSDHVSGGSPHNTIGELHP